ncbi:hypothetical protein [Nevskia sp.]|uniref:hypothetical protein n=1 Tax=Nevskia sp. TaxID=1929292 RepID=UPI003F6F83F1
MDGASKSPGRSEKRRVRGRTLGEHCSPRTRTPDCGSSRAEDSGFSLGDAAMGSVFFGYFLLRQKKVTRAIERKSSDAGSLRRHRHFDKLSQAPLIPLFLYVDATSGDLAAHTAPAVPAVEALAPMAEAIASAVDSATALRHCREFLGTIGMRHIETRPTSIHARLSAVNARPQEFPTLAHAARHAALSPSCFQHRL